MHAREYPYPRAVLLNAAYDVLDRMAIPVAYADSRAGIVRFGDGASRMELTQLLRGGGEVTRVEIAGTEQELESVLLDELRAALYQNFSKRRTPE